MVRVFSIFAILCLLITAGAKAHAASIENIRFGARGDLTRIVIELDNAQTYRPDTLSAPPRLLVDFKGRAVFSGRHQSDPTGLVKNIRFGTPDAQTSRLVFDLIAPASIDSHFILPPSDSEPSYRLVMDIKRHSGQGQSPKQPSSSSSPAASLVSPPSLKLHTIETQKPAVLPTGGLLHPLPTPRPFLAPMDRPKYIIVIDAGHGGGDPGGIGYGKVREKDIVLAIAKNLEKKLEETGRYDVRLTRTGDYYIKLRERFHRARDMGADMFISVHADKIDKPHVRGASVYTLSETASDAETARLAQQENNAGMVAGVDLAVEDHEVANILLDLVRRETQNESKLFAELLVDSLQDHNIRTLSNPHRYAGFAVLKAPDIPSVLIEAGFLSNREDAGLLQDSAYQGRLSQAVLQSIELFFDRLERLNQ